VGLPVIRENSWVPRLLSKISPIEIGAISLGLFVFVRGAASSTTRRHETIHYRQWLECLIVFFPLLYAYYYLKAWVALRSGPAAYRAIPFEREAYAHEDQPDYVRTRRLFAWWWFR
jgi:hypothetical protein